MKAITFQGLHTVRVDDVPKPSIQGSRDVLLRVTLSALCGSDLHIYNQRSPVNEGAVIGHEFVGVVEDVGHEVMRFKSGDRVVAAFYTACGHCDLCRRGWYSQCVSKATFGHGEFWGGLGGGQAEYVVVPDADSTLEPIPEGMSDEDAIFVGDIMSTAYFGAERAEIKPGDVVAVVGAGPVGLLTVQAAQLWGPARVYAIDMVDQRLELAQEYGAIPVNARAVNPVEHIQKETGGRGADSSIECVGVHSAIMTSINVVRGGGTISVVGVPDTTMGDFPYIHAWLKDLTFRAGWCNVQAHMRPLLDLIAAGKLKPASIISHRMKLDDGEDAYRMFEAREATKIVFTAN
jgi:threonine dehydrogenase-like Zn-dependent dehydrogenase